MAVGFGAGTELLAVLAHGHMQIVDCVNGNTLEEIEGREAPSPFESSAIGIGPLAGERIVLASEWVGGLRSSAAGWKVRRVAPNWPYECAVLYPPKTAIWTEWWQAAKIVEDADPIGALGFSDSGRTLVVLSSELHLWVRD